MIFLFQLSPKVGKNHILAVKAFNHILAVFATFWLKAHNLAAGVPLHEILGSYPTLTPEDVHAAIAYAAGLAREQVVPFDHLRP